MRDLTVGGSEVLARWLRGMLVAAALALPLCAQPVSLSVTQWDLPSVSGTEAFALIVDKTGVSGASKVGTVWYTTGASPSRLIRFVPGVPLASVPANWTSWPLGEPAAGLFGGIPTSTPYGLRITPGHLVFVQTPLSLERLDPSTNLHTLWLFQAGGNSDLALDASNNAWVTTCVDGSVADELQRLSPVGATDATITTWAVGGGAGCFPLSGVRVHPTSGLIYYSESVSNSIGELNPGTNGVRRWLLSGAPISATGPGQLDIDSSGDVWVISSNNKIIRLNVSTNLLTAFSIPATFGNSCVAITPGNPTCGLEAASVLFTEVVSGHLGLLAPTGGASPVATVTPTTATVTPSSVLCRVIDGIASACPTEQFTETPLTGTTSPVNTPVTAKQTGSFLEIPVPIPVPGNPAPQGIDRDPPNGSDAFYYTVTFGGPTDHRIGHTVVCLHHRVHGHISTEPANHTATFDQHHGQHGHTVPAGVDCPPHAPGHIPGVMPEPEEGLFAPLAATPDFTAAVNADAGAAERGAVVQLFGSAEGLFVSEDESEPATEFAAPASGSPLYHTTGLPEVRIGGIAAKVLFSGLAPGLKGVWQIDVVIPEHAPAGTLPVNILYGDDELTSTNITVK